MTLFISSLAGHDWKGLSSHLPRKGKQEEWKCKASLENLLRPCLKVLEGECETGNYSSTCDKSVGGYLPQMCETLGLVLNTTHMHSVLRHSMLL